MGFISEQELEEYCLNWFQEDDMGYKYKNGKDIEPGSINSERENFQQVILVNRLEKSISKLNRDFPDQVIKSAITKLTNANLPNLISSNRQFYNWIKKGLQVKYFEGNEEFGRRLKIIDFENPNNNDWLVVNQFKIQGPKHNRIPDIVVFINGLPIAVVELKNPANEKTNI